MLEYMPFIWGFVILITVVEELISRGRTAICFLPAGIAAFILSVLPLGIPVWIQTAVFFAISLILLLVTKIILKKILSPNTKKN